MLRAVDPFPVYAPPQHSSTNDSKRSVSTSNASSVSFRPRYTCRSNMPMVLATAISCPWATRAVPRAVPLIAPLVVGGGAARRGNVIW